MSKRNGHERKVAREALGALSSHLTTAQDQAQELLQAATRLRAIMVTLPTDRPIREAIATLPADRQAEVVRLADQVADLGGPRLFVREGEPRP